LSSKTAIRNGTPNHTFHIRQRYGSAIDVIRAILRHIAFDGYEVSGLQRILAPTPPAKTVWRPALDRIVRYFAAGVLHINVVVDMRVHPFHFCDETCELQRPILIVLYLERVERKRWRGERWE